MARTLVLLTRGPRKNTIIEADEADLTLLEQEEGAKDLRGRDGLRPDRDDFATPRQPGYVNRELKAGPPPAPLVPEMAVLDPEEPPPKGRGGVPRHGRP